MQDFALEEQWVAFAVLCWFALLSTANLVALWWNTRHARKLLGDWSEQ
jgi:hypothetical protein